MTPAPVPDSAGSAGHDRPQRSPADRSEALLQMMYDIVSHLAPASTVPEVVEVLTHYGAGSFGEASFSVWLFDDDGHSVTRMGWVDSSAFEPPTNLEFLEGGPALERLSAGETVVIEDCEIAGDTYPLLCAWLSTAARRSAVLAPLRIDGCLVGVISYGFSEPHTFDAAEQRAVKTLAAETAQALHRARLREAEHRSRDRLERLFQFTTSLSMSVTLDDVIDVVAQEGSRFAGAISVRVALLDESRQIVTFLRGRGVGGQLGSSISIDAAAIGCEAIRTGRLVTTTTHGELAERFPESPILSEPTVGRAIATPLRRGRDVLGAWVLAFAEPGPADDDDLKLIQLLAERASHALRRSALHTAEAAARVLAERRRVVSELLNRAATTDDVGRAVAGEGREIFEADGLALFVVDPEDITILELVAHDGLNEDRELWERIPREAPLAADAFLRAEPHFVTGGDEVRAAVDGAAVAEKWRAAAILPLVPGERSLGLLVLGFTDAERVTPTTRVALSGLAAEVSVALARTRRYDVEHEAAITLQRSLLPDTMTPSTAWVTSTWYTPGSEHLEVGGDLFDLSLLDDERLVVVVGDIVGHGIGAAAAMGQLRSAAKALALVDPRPSVLLRGLQAFARATPGVLGSSICVATLDADGTGRYACAGHPFPVVRRADATVDVLDAGRSPLLGIGDDDPDEAPLTLEHGDTLVLYTDGLIERRDEIIDESVQRLSDHLSAREEPLVARRIVDGLLAGSMPRDDIVVVCVARAD